MFDSKSPVSPVWPVITWVSNPMLPNETGLVRAAGGAGFSSESQLMLCNVGDVGDAFGDSNCQSLKLLQPSEESVKFTVPEDRPLAVWLLRDTSSNRTLATINKPELWWSICHNPDHKGTAAGAAVGCQPGSILKVVGRSLAFGSDSSCIAYAQRATGANQAAVTLTPLTPGEAVTLHAFEASCYSASFALPASIHAGTYQIAISNNLRGSRYYASDDVYDGDPDQKSIEIMRTPQW